MVDDIGKQVRTGAYWAIGLKLIHQLYHVVVMLVVARVLGPAVFGVIALAWAMVAFFEQFTRLGLPAAIVRKQDLTSEQTYTAFTYCFVSSIAMSALLVAFAPVLAYVFEIPDLVSILPPLAILFPLSAYYYICIALLQRELRFRLFATTDMVLGFVQSTATLVLALLGYGIWALVVGRLLGNVVAVVVLAVATRWIPRLNWRIGSIRPMFHYASLEFLRAQLRYVESYVSYWIIGYNMVPSALGLLDRAGSITRIPVLTFQRQIGTILVPSFSRLREDPPRLRQAFAKSLISTALLMVGPFVGLALVSGVFVPVVLGQQWVPMVTTLQILCGAAVFRVVSGTSQSLNLATASYRRQTAVGGISAMVNIGGCLAGLPWGIEGVSAGLLVAAMTLFVLSTGVALRTVDAGPKLLVNCLAPAVLCAAIMAAVVQILRHAALTQQNAINLVLLIAVGVIVYGTCALCIRHDGVQAIRQDVFADLSGLLNRVKPVVDEKTD